MFEYEGLRRVLFDTSEGTLSFVPVCPKCGRFVKADHFVVFSFEWTGRVIIPENASCKKCGRVMMVFEGFID